MSRYLEQPQGRGWHRGRSRRPRDRIWVVLVALMVAATAAFRSPAATLIDSLVEHEGSRYRVHSEVRVELPVARVRQILTQFENIAGLNPGIKETRVLAREGANGVRMAVVAEVCIFGGCLDYAWEQDIRLLSSGDILAVIDPSESDFEAGWARWRLRPDAGGTRLIFDASVAPRFWIPPLVGPWLLERRLSSEALATARGIESASQGQDAASSLAPGSAPAYSQPFGSSGRFHPALGRVLSQS